MKIINILKNIINKNKKPKNHMKEHIQYHIQYLIKQTNGRYFRLEFQKKDGSLRVVNTKEKDLASLRGGENKVKDAGYLVAFDRNKRQYVSFKPEAVKRIKCGSSIDFRV
jgi:hypothetical protein